MTEFDPHEKYDPWDKINPKHHTVNELISLWETGFLDHNDATVLWEDVTIELVFEGTNGTLTIPYVRMEKQIKKKH